MADKPVIKLLNSGLSEDENGEIIAVGFLDIEAMGALKIDDYQREFLRPGGAGKRTSIQNAVDSHVRLPSIVVGMRGERFSSRGETMYLEDPAYIVDGLQRVFTLKEYAEKHPEESGKLRIGAEIRFDTTKESEKELFHALNAYRTAVSGNVLLRNMRDKNKGVMTLYGLSMSDTSSPLFKRVQWNQRMTRGELITAIMLAHVANSLHTTESETGHKFRGNMERVAQGLEQHVDQFGMKQFRENIVTFFGMMDEVFHLGKIEFREKAASIKGNFLMVLSQMLAQHQNFWHGNKLLVGADYKRKLAMFPLDEPEIARLSASGTMAQPILFKMLCDHMNRGRRLNRLHPRVIRKKD